METTAGREAVSSALEPRIDRMHRNDRWGALAFVVALWFVLLFVLWAIWPQITDGGIRIVLVVSAIGLLALNTAAIIAMLRHYEGDKHFIYALDLKHLDEMRRQKRL